MTARRPPTLTWRQQVELREHACATLIDRLAAREWARRNGARAPELRDLDQHITKLLALETALDDPVINGRITATPPIADRP